MIVQKLPLTFGEPSDIHVHRSLQIEFFPVSRIGRAIFHFLQARGMGCGAIASGLDNLKARGDSEALPTACGETCGR